MNKKILSVIIVLILLIGGYFLYMNLKGKTEVEGSAGWCEGTKLVFFPGGPENGPFADVVYNGARMAERDLGPEVKYVWSDWNPDKMVIQFKDAIADVPDGIIMMGHPGSEVLAPFMEEAERKGVIVTLANVDLPDIREKYVDKGFGYVGQVLYESGLMVSDGIIRKYNPQEGTETIVFGVSPVKSPSRYQRTKGSVDGLENNGLIVHEVTFPLEVEEDAKSDAGRKMFADALAKYPDTKIIITDHGAVTASVPFHFQNLGIDPGEIIVAGFDLSPDTITGIKSGYIDLVHDQQPYLQGYLSVVQACLTEKYDFAGLYINTGVGLVDDSNIDVISDLVEEKIR